MMRTLALSLVVSLLPAPPAVPATAAPTGREVMDAQKARLELHDEERVVAMDIVDAKGRVRKRKVQMWNLRAEDGTQKLMLTFLEPRDIQGTGLLTWENVDRDDDQWLYLPSTGKEKRISPAAKKNRFMGTEFTYEDLRGENLERNTYRLEDDGTIGDQPCYRVEAVPAGENERKESGYGRRVLWIAKDTYLTLRVEYFDRADQKIKVLDNSDVVQLEGSIVRPNRAVMTNLRTKAATSMSVVSRAFNQGHDATLFTLRHLKSR